MLETDIKKEVQLLVITGRRERPWDWVVETLGENKSRT